MPSANDISFGNDIALRAMMFRRWRNGGWFVQKERSTSSAAPEGLTLRQDARSPIARRRRRPRRRAEPLGVPLLVFCLQKTKPSPPKPPLAKWGFVCAGEKSTSSPTYGGPPSPSRGRLNEVHSPFLFSPLTRNRPNRKISFAAKPFHALHEGAGSVKAGTL